MRPQVCDPFHVNHFQQSFAHSYFIKLHPSCKLSRQFFFLFVTTSHFNSIQHSIYDINHSFTDTDASVPELRIWADKEWAPQYFITVNPVAYRTLIRMSVGFTRKRKRNANTPVSFHCEVGGTCKSRVLSYSPNIRSTSFRKLFVGWRVYWCFCNKNNNTLVRFWAQTLTRNAKHLLMHQCQ